MRAPHRIIATVVVVAAVASCTDLPVAPMAAPAGAALTRSTGNNELSLYGHGSKEGLITACQAPGYKQLDFWLGYWEVRPQGSTGRFFPSIIEKELDGCVLEENWFSNARSINTYDAGTNTYNQHYVDQTGFSLVMGGGKQLDGSVRMHELRYIPCANCPTGLFGSHDVWTFSMETPDSIRQNNLVINPNNGNVIANPWDGRYRRVEPFTMTFTDGPSPCATSANNRQLDFMIGEWVVTMGNAHGQGEAHGNGSVQTTVTRELRGCLIEEKIDGPGGYRGWSYNNFKNSANYNRWYRTYVDNLGGRVFLSGNLENGSMVMTGHKSTADGAKQDVRVTFTPDGANRVVETWEVLAADGVTYEMAEQVMRVRKASAN